MGCMWRCDKMSLCDMYLQPEAAFETLSQLGEMGCVQFLDMNADAQPHQKEYVADLCRCAEMERKLVYMVTEMEKDKMKIPEVPVEPRALQPNEMLAFESLLEKWEMDVVEMVTNLKNLRKHYSELEEMSYMLDYIGPMLGDDQTRRESKVRYATALAEMGMGGQLDIITGVVRRSRCFPFEMMMWRISRGNIYYRQASMDRIIEDPQTGTKVRKVAFLAICQGEALSARVRKVCNGFRANLYPCPKTLDERMDMETKISTKLQDIEQVIKKSQYHRCRALRVIRTQWHGWMVSVKKAKLIYHNLNLFNLDITKNCLIGQCWVPDTDLNRVQSCIEKVSQTIGTAVPSFMSMTHTNQQPPTFHRTNKFTRGFQLLINAYGDSYYRELNPGLYTIVTFPFIFALMFGDIGHGGILLLFGAWMVFNESKFMKQKSKNEIWNIFFGGRYVILLMGMFSIYTGFIYNDCFSKPFNIFGSYWLNQYSDAELKEAEHQTLNAKFKTKKVYWFGKDPAWSLASNKIQFENSVKMKMSIIFGVIHMCFGIFLSLIDHCLHKRYYAIFLEFIPQILFLMCFLWWLVFLIVFKWFYYDPKILHSKRKADCAPSVLILFIDMVLLSKSKSHSRYCQAYLFDGQRTIQMVLVCIGLCCIPVILLGTPFYLKRFNEKKRMEVLGRFQKFKESDFRRYQRRSTDFDKRGLSEEEREMMEELHKYSHSFGELMIHQAISTIEFVLSTVSHTASYLRLWALSLAHSELSNMLWKMVLARGLADLGALGGVFLVFTFLAWSVFTLSILVVMEGLSAFLHTLRLHWVEFMSKFYLGGGYPFHPFTFRDIISCDDKMDYVCKKTS